MTSAWRALSIICPSCDSEVRRFEVGPKGVQVRRRRGPRGGSDSFFVPGHAVTAAPVDPFIQFEDLAIEDRCRRDHPFRITGPMVRAHVQHHANEDELPLMKAERSTIRDEDATTV